MTVDKSGSPDGLNVALVQCQLAWHDPAANRDALTGLIQKALEQPTDLVILPEMFSTGFSMASAEAEPEGGVTTRWMQAQADQTGCAIMGSLMLATGKGPVNRLLVAQPGMPLLEYDKKHLFRMAGEHDHYRPGTRRLVFGLRDLQICPQVCYDLRFPVWQRNRGDYDVLVLVANWPAARREHWRTLLQARAIENLAYVVGVNRIGHDGNGIAYAGDSLVYGPDGTLLLDLADRETIGRLTLEKSRVEQWRETFPAWMDADKFEIS